MAPKNRVLVIAQDELERLDQWARSGATPQRVALRARILLHATSDQSEKQIGTSLGVGRRIVAFWKKRVREQGIGCIWEVAPGRGRKPFHLRASVIEATLQSKPSNASHWSTRSFSKAHRVSKSTVNRIWQDHGLKPHLSKSFKLSRDPKFLEKLNDVVGVYMTPPQNAVVLCVDEKSQIQALDRTQPGLPLKPGRCGTYTHDYVRHGTTTLFAALQVIEGRVIGQCYPKHRHQEFLSFLKRLDAEFPQNKSLHLILDNYGTHGHPRVRAWLKRHPRFVLHFIPTSSSWLNLIERWFAELTQKVVRRGAFHSIEDLHSAIDHFMHAWNESPKPFVWTASVERIVQKIEKSRNKLESLRPGCTTYTPKRPYRLQRS